MKQIKITFPDTPAVRELLGMFAVHCVEDIEEGDNGSDMIVAGEMVHDAIEDGLLTPVERAVWGLPAKV